MVSIPQVSSAYKTLPSEITRKVNINKTYKKTRNSVNAYNACCLLWSAAAFCQFLAKNLALGGLNLALSALCMALGNKPEYAAIVKQYSDAYKEIVAKAKHIKELKAAK